MDQIVNTLFPVFFIILLGVFLRRFGFISPDLARGVNRLAYWVGLPCLLFYAIAEASYDFHVAGKTFFVVLVSTIVCVGVGYLAAWVMRVPVSGWGTYVQGAFRGNLAFVGLAVVIYSFDGAANAAAMGAVAVLVLALIVPVYNVICVAILLVSRHEVDRRIFGRVVKGIAGNPLIIACVGGVVYSFLFASMPVAVSRSLSAVGQMALPLALLGIGATLAERKHVTEGVGVALSASIIKIVVSPLAGFLVALLVGLGAGEMRIALIMLACPTAVASFVLTEELGGDGPLAARIVVVSSVLSAISLAVVVGLF